MAQQEIIMNKDTVLGFVRHLLTFGGGFLVASDFIPADQLDVAVGAVVSLVGIVWSAFDKKDK